MVLLTDAWNRDFVQMREGGVDRGEVALHDRIAALAVGFLDRRLDRADRGVLRQHPAHREEAGLHDGVDAPAHAGLARHLVCIDDVNAQLARDDLLLHLARQMIPNFIGRVRRVEQEGRAAIGRREHIHPFEKRELMASDEARRA